MLKRDIEADIDRGHFVSHQPVIILTILWRFLTRSKDYRSFLSYFRYYFGSGGSFSAGLFRFAFFCMLYFPLAALAFYFTLAYLTNDQTLYLTTSISVAAMLGLAITASWAEIKLNYKGRLFYAWALSLVAAASVFNVSFFSQAVVDYHSEIWLYMILTGFTIVTNFRLGVITAVICSLMPLTLEWRHQSQVTLSSAFQGFGLFGTYFLASICKFVSDTYAIKAKENEAIAIQGKEEISFLLNSLPQGVIQVDQDLRISEKTSIHTLEVLDVKSIVGDKIKDVLLDPCTDSADDLDQCFQALFSILGESDLNYEANSDKLMLELNYQGKCLKVTWNPHFSKNGVCESMLITLLDISKEKAHEAEIKTQQDQMRTVFELLSIGNPDRVQKFLTDIENFTKETSKGMQSETSNLDIDEVLIKLHTFKGIARTLGLDGLSSEIHVTEDSFSAVRSSKHNSRQLREGCTNSLRKLSERNQNYRSCFSSTFRQQSIYSFDSRLGQFTLNKEDSESLINGMFEHLPDTVQREMVEFVENKNKTMLKEFLGEQYQIIKNIATKLNKEPPIYDIQVEQVALTQGTMDVLEATLGHLFNNHVDHGIEDRAERLRQSKNPRGKIVLRSRIEAGHLVLNVFDDGRGLDVVNIAEKARLPLGTERQQLVDAVFTPGVSTARCLTEVSGRGIGMGAVRSALRAVGGDINIELIGPTRGEFQKISFILKLPLHCSAVQAA